MIVYKERGGKGINYIWTNLLNIALKLIRIITNNSSERIRLEEEQHWFRRGESWRKYAETKRQLHGKSAKGGIKNEIIKTKQIYRMKTKELKIIYPDDDAIIMAGNENEIFSEIKKTEDIVISKEPLM